MDRKIYSIMLNKIREIWGKTDDVILRYPMVLATALIAALSAITAIELNGFSTQFAVVKLTIVSCLGISLMFALKMLSQRINLGVLPDLVGIAVLAMLYFILPQKEEDFTEMYAYILVPAFIISHLLVSFIAFFEKNREFNFWQYNKNLFINIFLTAVFTGILVGGVMLAILAVDKLFDMNFTDSLYPKTFSFLAILGSCFIFLLFNDSGLRQLEEDQSYPQILKFFTQFVLIPLLLIYAVILYFYSAKILINWELPRGWVSYLILAYSVIGILALLLVHPLKDEGAKSWVKIFSKIFYYTLIPLVILLFVAIFTRILEYGYTEPRYFVLLLALWLTSVMLYFIFFKNATIKFIPISLFAFGLFSLVFPYLNALSVAKRSQKTELQKVLNKNGLLQNGKINFIKKIDNETVNEITNKMAFLSVRRENDFVFQFLDENTKKNMLKSGQLKNKYQISQNIQNQFKNIDFSSKNKNTERLEILSENVFTDVSGYQHAAKFHEFGDRELKLNNDSFTIDHQLQGDNKKFIITLNSKEKMDLLPQIQNILNQHRSGVINVPEIAAEGNLGNYHCRIIFKNLTKEKSPENRENIYFSEGLILIKKNN